MRGSSGGMHVSKVFWSINPNLWQCLRYRVMSLAIRLVGSFGNLLYVLGSSKCFMQSSMYSVLSSITIVLPLSVFLMIMSLFFARSRSAWRSCGVRLSLGCL